MDYNKNTQGNTQGERMRQTLRMKRKQRRMRKVTAGEDVEVKYFWVEDVEESSKHG